MHAFDNSNVELWDQHVQMVPIESHRLRFLDVFWQSATPRGSYMQPKAIPSLFIEHLEKRLGSHSGRTFRPQSPMQRKQSAGDGRYLTGIKDCCSYNCALKAVSRSFCFEIDCRKTEFLSSVPDRYRPPRAHSIVHSNALIPLVASTASLESASRSTMPSV